MPGEANDTHGRQSNMGQKVRKGSETVDGSRWDGTRRKRTVVDYKKVMKGGGYASEEAGEWGYRKRRM